MEDSKQLLNDIQTRNKKIEGRLNKINTNDSHRGKIEIQELKKELNKVKTDLGTLEYNMSFDDKINKGELKVLNGEYNNLKKKLESIEREMIHKENMELLKKGELSGIDKIKTEKNELENQIGQIEDQGRLINYIGKDIREANRNLNEAAVTVKDQDNKINNITDKVDNNQVKIGQAEAIENQMIRIAKCQRCALYSLIIILFIADIILSIVLIYKNFHK